MEPNSLYDNQIDYTILQRRPFDSHLRNNLPLSDLKFEGHINVHMSVCQS